MVGSGDRTEKIRTYNFPQDRITDHRIGVDVHDMPGVLDGELDKLIDALDHDRSGRTAGLDGRHGRTIGLGPGAQRRGDCVRSGSVSSWSRPPERCGESGSESARLDAEVLLGHVLGVDRSALIAHPETVLSTGQLDRYEAALDRGARAGEPVAYIRGIKEFYGAAISRRCRECSSHGPRPRPSWSWPWPASPHGPHRRLAG